MIKIIADSTCDLSKDLLEKYDIEIIPLHILLGDEEYLDGVNISRDQIFEWSNKTKSTPKTSAASIEDVVTVFQKYIDRGDEIIAFTISSSMSTTFNVFRLAAAELNAKDKISVIDSMNLSTGIGLSVIEAAIKAREGLSRKEIISYLDEIIPRVRASFVVDTLTFLHRGGRCSSVAALAGSVLKLHPRIIVSGGAMSADKKFRGNLRNVIMSYVQDLEPLLLQGKPDRVFITHSGCKPEIVDEVRNYLNGLHIFNEIIETNAGGVISSHCGPGTLGVLFIIR